MAAGLESEEDEGSWMDEGDMEAIDWPPYHSSANNTPYDWADGAQPSAMRYGMLSSPSHPTKFQDHITQCQKYEYRTALVLLSIC